VARASVPPSGLANAYASADALIDGMLRALERDDPDALRRLRVTETEYREIILPGSVREGRPLRRYPRDIADYAWGSLATRSFYHEQALLHGHKGRHFIVKAVEYDKVREPHCVQAAPVDARGTGDGQGGQARHGLHRRDRRPLQVHLVHQRLTTPTLSRKDDST
jgi:hypothetical protein